jgi:hypothetical protein
MTDTTKVHLPLLRLQPQNPNDTALILLYSPRLLLAFQNANQPFRPGIGRFSSLQRSIA